MPTLDFKCNTCHIKFEELVLGKNNAKILCPGCGGGNIARVYEGKWMPGAQKGAKGCQGRSCAGCAGCSSR